jgi:methylmalonyl-CoA/ethylmalonyl-CoA epimerase
MKVKAIDHICFVVRDLEASVEVYRQTLGMEPDGWYTAESESIRVARFYLENVALELMEPTRPDSEVGRFLEKRGEGFFLISYLVDDVADGLKELQERGELTLDKKPRARWAALLVVVAGRNQRGSLGGQVWWREV